jgi:hypothetical protein
MRRRFKLIGMFGAAGFIIAWLVVLFGMAVGRLGGNPARFTMLYLWLCPTSIMALALDSATPLEGLVGWLLIALSNAVLYSIVGAVVSLFVYPPWKSELTRIKLDD